MRFFLSVLALVFALGSPTISQGNDIRTAIQGVIGSQMQAFRDGDIPAAWSHASPMIKQIFGSEQRFAQMVQNGYPMVWQPGEVRFLDLNDANGQLRQRVMVKDAGNVFHVLEYEMIETAEGWQINGVRIVPAPELGA